MTCADVIQAAVGDRCPACGSLLDIDGPFCGRPGEVVWFASCRRRAAPGFAIRTWELSRVNGGRPRWLGRNSAPWSGQSYTGATIRCSDQAASDVRRAAAARGRAGPQSMTREAGRPLAKGEARHRQYTETVCRRIEGEDPRFWVLADP